MAHYSATVPSTWPAETSFAYLSRFDHVSEWDPGIKRAKPLDTGEPRVGSKYEVVSSFLGREIVFVYKITDLDVGRRTVTLVGKSGSTTSIDTITVAADGAVTYDAKLEFSGLLKLSNPLMQVLFQKIGDNAKKGLKEKLAEAPPVPA